MKATSLVYCVVALAAMLLNDITVATQPYTRLIYVASGDDTDCAVVDWAVNMAMNHASVQIPLERPSKQYIKLDLEELSGGDSNKLRLLLDTWELMAIDEPYFLGEVQIFNGTHGKFLKRVPQRHLNAELLTQFNTNVPVVEHRWFLRKLLSTLPDGGSGGLYYKFRGVPATQSEFLREFGGFPEREAQAALDRTRSDQKAAMLFSGVTGKPRAMTMFHSFGGHTAHNQGLIMITQDFADDNKDPRANPIRSLEELRFDATEIIAELRNGLHVFALYDGQGRRQDAAPDKIVRDHQIPAPYTNRLQAAISCIRCHGPDDGIKPMPNEIPELDLLSLGFLNRDGSLLIDTKRIDRLKGQFAARTDKPFDRARDDYSDATTFIASKYGVDGSSKVLAAHLTDMWAKFNYTLVDEEQAKEEIEAITGIEIDKSRSLAEVLAPLNKISIVDERSGKSVAGIVEDPFVKALKVFKPIGRDQFEVIFPDLAKRVRLVPPKPPAKPDIVDKLLEALE